MDPDDDDDAPLSSLMLHPLSTLKPDHSHLDSSHRRQLALVDPATALTTGSPFRLPDGWTVRKVLRRTGQKHYDKYYYEPGSGVEFRSLKAVERYLTGEEYAPKPKFSQCSATRKMVISDGKTLRIDEKASTRLQLVAVAPTTAAATSRYNLPDGWIVEEVPRTNTDSHYSDKYYYEPGTGRRFRSLIAVERYLAEMEDHVPLSEAFQSGNIAKKNRVSREKVNTADDPPLKVNWVLAGPGGDSWSPFIGELAVPDHVKQQWAERFTISVDDEHYHAPY